jgi:hypothetical protein
MKRQLCDYADCNEEAEVEVYSQEYQKNKRLCFDHADCALLTPYWVEAGKFGNNKVDEVEG